MVGSVVFPSDLSRSSIHSTYFMKQGARDTHSASAPSKKWHSGAHDRDAVAPLLRVGASGHQSALHRMPVAVEVAAAAERDPNSRRGRVSDAPKGAVNSSAVAALDTPGVAAALPVQRYAAVARLPCSWCTWSASQAHQVTVSCFAVLLAMYEVRAETAEVLYVWRRIVLRAWLGNPQRVTRKSHVRRLVSTKVAFPRALGTRSAQGRVD